MLTGTWDTCYALSCELYVSKRERNRRTITVSLRALQSSQNMWPGKKILVMATACVLTTQVAALVTFTAVRTLKADSHIASRAHAPAMPFSCHAVPLRVQNVSFPFDLHSAAVSDSHLPCHALTMPFFSRPQHSTTVSRRPCCGLEKKGIVEE